MEKEQQVMSRYEAGLTVLLTETSFFSSTSLLISKIYQKDNNVFCQPPASLSRKYTQQPPSRAF